MNPHLALTVPIDGKKNYLSSEVVASGHQNGTNQNPGKSTNFSRKRA
jgi:hypothetical protein